ncbi:MAG: DUF3467 domain-containing protein [Alloacidobacterium sp.]|jgi:hypothetical protein
MQDFDSIEGKYANYFQIGHNAIEVIVDFGQLYSGEPFPLLHTRIITSPSYASDLLKLLAEALAQHDAQYGDSHDC